MRIEQVAPEHRGSGSYRGLRRAWPEFLLHDPVSNEHWHRLYSEFPEFQFVAVEGVEVLAEGCAIPVCGMPADWQDWTGMAFPESRSYVVPGALVPVEIDVERDQGLYVEPCVWMRHA